MKKHTIVLAAAFSLTTSIVPAQTLTVAGAPPGTGGLGPSGVFPDVIHFPGMGPFISGAGSVSGLYVDVDALCYGYTGFGFLSPSKVAHYEFSLSSLSGPSSGFPGTAVAGEETFGEHIADVFSSDGTGGNLLLWDGDGAPLVGIPLAGAFGLFEASGEDLNGWANNIAPAHLGGMYFSVDAFAASMIYSGSLSAADVLVALPVLHGYDTPSAGLGTPPAGVFPYAFAPTIGLDPSFDDIDALVILDAAADFTFTGAGGTDYILFSLTPGSVSLTLPSPYTGASAADILYFDSSGGSGIFLPAPALGISPAADLNALDIKIRQEALGVSADTNGHVTTLWNDLVPPFSYTVQVANADAPYFGWTDLGAFSAPGVMGFFTDTSSTVQAGADTAGNYTTATFTNGSNEGVGFGPWSFVSNGDSIIGLTNSTAATDSIDSTNGLSFYLYGDTNGLYANLSRPFESPLTEEEMVTMKFAYDLDGGSRGIDILDVASNALLSVRVTPIDKLVYQFAGESDVTVATNYNGGTSVVTIAVTQIAGNQLNLTLTRNDGVATNATSSLLSAPAAGINLYNGGHTGDNLSYALFVNNLKLIRNIRDRLYRTKQQPW